MKQNKIIISWGSGIRRSSNLAEMVNYKDIQLRYVFKRKYLKPLNYIINFSRTIAILISIKPSNVVAVSPPSLILYAVHTYSFVFDRNLNVIVDCHNGVLRSEWVNLPFISSLMRKSNVVISHNHAVKEDIDSVFGLSSVVLGDPLIDLSNEEYQSLTDASVSSYLNPNKVNVLVPVSYAADEPIAEIIELAAKLQVTHNFILTGRFTKLFDKDYSPLGVTFTGYTSENDYLGLLKFSDVMLCLTLDDKIQMCALIESVSALKDIVCTANSVNQTIFSAYSPCFTDTDVDSLVDSFKNLSDSGDFTAARKNFIYDYSKKWALEATEVLQ